MSAVANTFHYNDARERRIGAYLTPTECARYVASKATLRAFAQSAVHRHADRYGVHRTLVDQLEALAIKRARVDHS